MRPKRLGIVGLLVGAEVFLRAEEGTVMDGWKREEAAKAAASPKGRRQPTFSVAVEPMTKAQEKTFETAVVEMLAAAAAGELRRTANKEERP